ncbi:MAG: hypothetical protein ACQESF_01990 [Nanobdellota archaeon]
MSNNFTIDLIKNPSNISKYILELAKESYNKHTRLASSSKFKDKVKMRILYLNEFNNIYSFLSDFSKNKNTKDFKLLFKQLSNIFDYIAINNILLAYAYNVEKVTMNPVITKEDEKLFYLGKLYQGSITITEFNKYFGHYALNPFELSSKRFWEYSNKELLKIAKFCEGFKINKTLSLEDYMKQKKEKLFPIYCALRESLKYIALLVVNDLRELLLDMEKKKNLNNIFDMSYNEVQGQIYS